MAGYRHHAPAFVVEIKDEPTKLNAIHVALGKVRKICLA
jgi:hypothetical protein